MTASEITTEATTEACYSLNGEEYGYDSLDEIIEQLRYEKDDEAIVGMTYYEATKKHYSPSDFFDEGDTDDVTDNMACRVHDVAGELGDDFMSHVPAEAKQELAAFVKAWADKHFETNFFIADGVKKLAITQADLDAHRPA